MDPVDVALVLALDVSASVDFAEFELMAGGLAAALRDPAVQAAATGGARGAAALAALFWSEAAEVAVGWTRLDGSAAMEGFARALEEAPRLPRPGATALGEGMAASLALLARCPAEATRQVLDMAGDGRANRGRPPALLRDLAVAAGVTVNALAVTSEEADLLGYFAAEVIGGPGAFAMDCPDHAAFGEAIRRKLLRELRGPGAVIA